MTVKKRLDIALVENGDSKSREKAKTLIKEGKVLVNGITQVKPGYIVSDSDIISFCGEQMKYVSRGGYKLEKALDVFNIDLKGCICIDVGASTGGFTDAMLQNGADKVFSVDVGHDQLDESLKKDSRVINLEGINFRNCTNETIDEKVDFASVDVSFISLKLIIPVLKRFIKDNAKAVCLIKPQFEAGKGKVGKNGVVRDPEVHADVIDSILDFAVNEDFDVLGVDFSPIKGPQGNIEYLLCIQNAQQKGKLSLNNSIKEIVLCSHRLLNGS